MNKLDQIVDLVDEVKKLLAEYSGGPGAGEEAEEKAASTSARTQCPKCSSLNFKTMEDKSKVIYYHQGAPIYGKKGVCNQCGTEFSLS